MYDALIKLMIVAALIQCGISLKDFSNCHGRACAQTLEKRSRDVLRIDWKPISVFPDEARRFR